MCLKCLRNLQRVGTHQLAKLWYRTYESHRAMCVVAARNLGLWICHEALRRNPRQRFPKAASPGWPGGPVREPAQHLQSVASLSRAAVSCDAV